MKKTIINKGAKLVVLPTTQFKTLHIAIDFSTLAEAKSISARALVSYLTAVSSAKYKNQQAVAKKTIDLYGAQYQTDVFRIGQMHHVRYTFQMPAPTYLSDESQLLKDAFDFLQEMIFNPLVENNAFDEETFLNEQKSLINELVSIKDDKNQYAIAKLRELTYDSPGMQMAAIGNKEDVAQLTSSEVYKAYIDMLHHNMMNIVVLGDVDHVQVSQILNEWPIVAHQDEKSVEPFYRQSAKQQPKELVDYQIDINQAMLTMAYQIDVAPFDNQRFAILVMNSLLGGTPLSKLFMNVREKESLAYSIYSRWQQDTGFLTIFAGLDSEKVSQADGMIKTQIKALQLGDFDHKTLEAVKQSLINDYLSRHDSPLSQIEVTFSQLLTAHETSEQKWIERINAVTAQEVQQVAQMLSFQSRYILLPEV